MTLPRAKAEHESNFATTKPRNLRRLDIVRVSIRKIDVDQYIGIQRHRRKTPDHLWRQLPRGLPPGRGIAFHRQAERH